MAENKEQGQGELLQVARCALADLEGLRDEGVFYYDGEGPKPPQVETIEELEHAIAKAEKHTESSPKEKAHELWVDLQAEIDMIGSVEERLGFLYWLDGRVHEETLKCDRRKS